MDVVVDEMVSARPAAALRPFIDHYTGYRQRGVEPAVHRGLPSPYLTLIFTLDEPLVISKHPDPAQPGGRFDTLIGGLHTSPAVITHDGRQSGLQLALRPLGVRALLGVPAAALYRLDLPADDVLGRLGSRIQAQLQEATTWPQRFAVLDRTLLDRLAVLDRGAAAGPAPEVVRAWQLLGQGGALPISRLAADLGWSPRHLGQRFRAEFGLSPKAAARVVRFHRARLLLQSRLAAGRPMHLADLSARCGYFDQAHLAREFRALAGCSPTAWAAAEFRNVQAWPPDEEGA